MNKELLAATALTASAAVLVPGAAQTQPMLVDWSGIYVSLGVGHGNPRDRVATDNHGGVALGRPWAVGTVGGGINWDTGAYLYGLEVDLNWLGSHSRGQTSGGADVETTLDHLLTARARLGVKANQAMLFATGGLAAANATLSTAYSDFGKSFASGAGSDTLLGWTAGVGAEVPATDRLFLNLTVLYYALQPLTVNATGVSPYTATYTPEGFLIRAALNLKLN